MLNDEWTLDDALGHNVLVGHIIDTIETIQPPFTLGIYGGWGSGKTSIMKQVYYMVGGTKKSYILPFNTTPEEEEISIANKKIIKEIKKEAKNHEAIWFNPWKHEIEANPLLGLLHEIREHFSLYNKATTKASKLAHVSVRSGLDILTNTIKEVTKIDLNPSTIEKYGDKYEDNNFEIRSSTQNFRIIFESAIKKLLNNGSKKLIIFIDDLDRCTDKKVIKLLEGIKLYLSTSNCIFIFGMDKNNVLRALEKNHINEEYLDKLFQSVIRIPISNKYENFINSVIISEYFSDILDTVDKKEKFSKLVTGIIEKNPRKIKNFTNSLKFYWGMKTDDNLDLTIFTLFHYLRIHYEDIFEILERDHSHFRALLNICKNEEPNTKIETYFKEVLNNPIMDIQEVITGDEGTIVNLATLKDNEKNIINDMRIKFKSLDNFKNYVAEECSTLDESKIFSYLGVIS